MWLGKSVATDIKLCKTCCVLCHKALLDTATAMHIHIPVMDDDCTDLVAVETTSSTSVSLLSAVRSLYSALARASSSLKHTTLLTYYSVIVTSSAIL